ncbi:MAG: porphobilinogen synthase, partial [Gammaproteobacteria bacterium]|nr:porphobilinogen synthase [Gammaproteobacteria bacterium]
MTRHFPMTRPRRLRSDDFSRRLVRETTLTPSDLIYPTFVIEGTNQTQSIDSMPGVTRKTIDLWLEDAWQAAELGIPLIALFPVVPAARKSLTAEESYRSDGLVQTAIRALKEAEINIGVMADVALDPYTSHGQDGLIDDSGYVMNDETVS